MKSTSRCEYSYASTLRGAVAVFLGGVLAISAGCSGDVAPAPVDASPDTGPLPESSTQADVANPDVLNPGDASVQVDTGSPQEDAPRDDAFESVDASVQHDSSSPQEASNPQEASTQPDAANHPEASAQGDAGADGGPADTGAGDARKDALPDAANDVTQSTMPFSLLDMCGKLDRAWGFAGNGYCADASAEACAITRSDNWGTDVMVEFINGSGYLEDCRINNIYWNLADDQKEVDYFNDIIGWSLSFFGCPSADFPRAREFALVPSEYSTSSMAFTTADLRLLSHYYAVAIESVLATKNVSLSAAEKDAIRASLADWAATRPSTIEADEYSLRDCPTDAGIDGAD